MEEKIIQIIIQSGSVGVAIYTLYTLKKIVGNHIEHSTEAMRELPSPPFFFTGGWMTGKGLHRSTSLKGEILELSPTSPDWVDSAPISYAA